MKKLLEFWENLRMFTSKTYRQEKMWQRGRTLWHDLDDNLPPAIGIKSYDEPRIKEFARITQTYSSFDKQAIAFYLEACIADIRKDFCEHTTGQEEEIERALWQIYSDHLNVLFPKD